MTKKYNQLTLMQRHKLEALVSAGNTLTAIARIIGVNRSTICREFKRYVPKKAVETGTT
jgi:IS30 family transposase